jgi:hypothetical protein
MSKIEEAIDRYISDRVDNAVSEVKLDEIVRDNVDFEDILKDNVDFGDLARDALLENVSTALEDAIPGALRGFDFKGLIKERVDFAELLQQNIDWHETAKDAVETEMTSQFHDLERGIDDKVMAVFSPHEVTLEALKGELAMLKLEVEKLKQPLPWYKRLFR